MAKKTEVEGQTIIRPFKMKKGTEVDDKFDGAEIRIRLAAPADTIEQATANMLALVVDGSEADRANALIDTFNSAAALAFQKEVKANANPGVDSTVAQLQAIADAAALTRNQRGGATGGKKAAVRAKAEKFEAVVDRAKAAREKLLSLRASDPETYNAQLQLMQALMPETVADLEAV